MTYNPDLHHRRSIRLRHFDYAVNGAYYVTICVQGRECLFGAVIDGEMRLNDAGRMVDHWWRELENKYPSIMIDAYIIMPNHFHGIVQIHDVGAGLPRPNDCDTNSIQGGETTPLRKLILGQIIGFFKYQSTKEINIMRDNPGVPVWQRNYYERVIRDDAELGAIREYITTNPQRWVDDEENPDRPKMPKMPKMP